jgi:hypothetical protein
VSLLRKRIPCNKAFDLWTSPEITILRKARLRVQMETLMEQPSKSCSVSCFSVCAMVAPAHVSQPRLPGFALRSSFGWPGNLAPEAALRSLPRRQCSCEHQMVRAPILLVQQASYPTCLQASPIGRVGRKRRTSRTSDAGCDGAVSRRAACVSRANYVLFRISRSVLKSTDV